MVVGWFVCVWQQRQQQHSSILHVLAGGGLVYGVLVCVSVCACVLFRSRQQLAAAA